MNRFHSGIKRGGFSALLRKMGSAKRGIQLPANNLQAGAKPEMGGSTQRRPNDKATQTHMDAKDFSGTSVGRRGSGSHDAPRRAAKLDPEHRIARGSPGTSGRMIHHKTHVKRGDGHIPEPHLIGARRSTFKKTRAGMHKGSAGMSDHVTQQHGVPAHHSVINRGPVPTGGFKHGNKMPSRTKVTRLAHKLNFHSSLH